VGIPVADYAYDSKNLTGNNDGIPDAVCSPEQPPIQRSRQNDNSRSAVILINGPGTPVNKRYGEHRKEIPGRSSHGLHLVNRLGTFRACGQPVGTRQHAARAARRLEQRGCLLVGQCVGWFGIPPAIFSGRGSIWTWNRTALQPSTGFPNIPFNTVNMVTLRSRRQSPPPSGRSTTDCGSDCAVTDGCSKQTLDSQ
jgi:hypothetical protein